MFVPEDENITDDLVNLIANELLIWHVGRAGNFRTLVCNSLERQPLRWRPAPDVLPLLRADY